MGWAKYEEDNRRIAEERLEQCTISPYRSKYMPDAELVDTEFLPGIYYPECVSTFGHRVQPAPAAVQAPKPKKKKRRKQRNCNAAA